GRPSWTWRGGAHRGCGELARDAALSLWLRKAIVRRPGAVRLCRRPYCLRAGPAALPPGRRPAERGHVFERDGRISCRASRSWLSLDENALAGALLGRFGNGVLEAFGHDRHAARSAGFALHVVTLFHVGQAVVEQREHCWC